MLALVKSLIAQDAPKDRFDNLEDIAAELEAGAVLHFGAMPQEFLSGAKATIAEGQKYRFDEEVYFSHRLDIDGGPTCHLIVAETEEGRHLALSRPIDEEGQDKLFGAQSLEAIVEKAAIQTLRVRENVEGFKGWVANSYRKQISEKKGSLAEPHRKPQDFNYCLLTSPGNDYGIELEKYEDGTLKVFATLYRPLTDIVHIALPSKSKTLQRKGKSRPWLSETGGMDALIETIRSGRAKTPPVNESAEILSHPSLETMVAPHETMLECDVGVAVRVIEEALLNKMPIAEVMRRVLGPADRVPRESIFLHAAQRNGLSDAWSTLEFTGQR